MDQKQYQDLLGDYSQNQVRQMLEWHVNPLKKGWKYGVGGFVLFVALLMGGMPVYGVWQQGLAGEAELKRAQQNRQITIEEAAAVKESSLDLASAEVIRAQGVKEANDIIADGLGGPEGYLRYLYINGLNSPDSNCEVIYVPTEAGLPILEAGKRD